MSLAGSVAIDYLLAIERLKPLELETSHKQVINAERFVYSSTDDFTIVEEIIRENPSLHLSCWLTMKPRDMVHLKQSSIDSSIEIITDCFDACGILEKHLTRISSCEIVSNDL